MPIVFGEKQKARIEEAFKGEWRFSTVEMVKRNEEWYAHLVLKKTVEVPDEPETVMAIDRGEASRRSGNIEERSSQAREGAVLERWGNQADQRALQPHKKKTSREE